MKAGAYKIENGEAKDLSLKRQRRELVKHAFDATGVQVGLGVIQGDFVVMRVHGLRTANWVILGSDFETAKEALVKFCQKHLEG